MSETRKVAAILVADVVGYSRLAGADEDRSLSRLRGLRSDLIDPTISVHHGRIVKRTGDGSVIEFRSVVDAVRCAVEVQHAIQPWWTLRFDLFPATRLRSQWASSRSARPTATSPSVSTGPARRN